jgi:hypothetical protein
VKLLSIKHKVPAVAQESGTIYREATVIDHFKTAYHEAAKKAYARLSLQPAAVLKSSSIGRSILTANEHLANKVGALMTVVYNDAKRLTLSGNSFPSRIVAGKLSTSFNVLEDVQADRKIDLQYVSPNGHRDFLRCIVESNREEFAKRLLVDALALSLRCDGSVDRTQIDKLYVMIKALDANGEEHLYFLGADEPDERGSKGMCAALQTACNKTIGVAGFDSLLVKTSSIVTDGATANTGSKGGLWTLLDETRIQAYDRIHKSDKTHKKPVIQGQKSQLCPLMKFWCAVHRSNLAWESVTSSVSDVKLILQQLASISTFFHRSGLRTRELRKIAEDNNYNLVSLPRTFEVRWTEFTNSLLTAVLRSWQSLVTYFRSSDEKAASGFFRFLTDLDNLKIIAFLTDILTVFSRYQKQLQDDTLTIVDVGSHTDKVKAKLANLKTTPLLGGWVQTLNELIVKTDDSGIVRLLLYDVELHTETRRRKQHHTLVTDRRDSTAIMNEVSDSLIEFLAQRFASDQNLLDILVPFVKLQNDANLSAVHSLVCCDLNLQNFALEYGDLMDLDNIDSLRKMHLKQLIATLVKSNTDNFSTIIKVFARVLAAKPHSADVERLISASNNLKSCDRSRMNIETTNLYLYIHYNMPVLSEWDPRAAVMHWLSEKRRRVRSRKKARQQPYFNGVFCEASCTAISASESESDDPEECTESNC